MKNLLFLKRTSVPAVLLLICNLLQSLQAQEVPPPPPNAGPDDKPGFPEKSGRRLNSNMPQPFLMAGDPRFQKMLLIALSPPDQIKDKLSEWPDYQKMDDEKKAKLGRFIESFRERIQRIAEEEARHMDLMLPDDKKDAFIRAYWNKRIAAEGPMRKEVEEKHKAAMQTIRGELKKEFR